MEWAFIEDHDFTADIPRYFGDDAIYLQFQLDLLEQPEAGQVIRGTGGFRKVRWADKRRGKGTRGGLRVIYLLVREVSTMALFMVYDKGEQDDLSLFSSVRENLTASSDCS